MPLTRSFAASPSATDTTAGLRADTQPGGPHGPARQASLSRSAARRARSRCRLWNGTAPAPATGEAVRSLRGRSVVRHAQDRESGTPWSSVVQADTQRSLPLASRSFGAVLCALVGEHLATLLEPLPEMHRVLTPGGRMVFSVYHLPWPPSASRPTSRRASSAASARTGTSSMIIAAHYVLCRALSRSSSGSYAGTRNSSASYRRRAVTSDFRSCCCCGRRSLAPEEDRHGDLEGIRGNGSSTCRPWSACRHDNAGKLT